METKIIAIQEYVDAPRNHNRMGLRLRLPTSAPRTTIAPTSDQNNTINLTANEAGMIEAGGQRLMDHLKCDKLYSNSHNPRKRFKDIFEMVLKYIVSSQSSKKATQMRTEIDSIYSRLFRSGFTRRYVLQPAIQAQHHKQFEMRSSLRNVRSKVILQH